MSLRSGPERHSETTLEQDREALEMFTPGPVEFHPDSIHQPQDGRCFVFRRVFREGGNGHWTMKVIDSKGRSRLMKQVDMMAFATRIQLAALEQGRMSELIEILEALDTFIAGSRA